MNGPTFAPAPTAPAVPVARPPQRPPQRPNAVKPADDAAAALRVLTYLRLHWLMILFCGGLLGAGMAYAAWTLMPPKFESKAVLRVASAPSGIGGGGDPTRGATAFSTYMKTTAQLMKSQFVLESALNDTRYKISELVTLTEQKNPIKFLDEKLVIGYSEGSEILNVSMEGDRPEDIRQIVNAVTDAYHREVVEKEIKEKMALRVKVGEAKTQLESMMKDKAGNNPELMRNAAGILPTAMPGAMAMPGDPAAPPLFPMAGAPLPGQAVPEPEPLKKARHAIAVQKFLNLEGQLKQFPMIVRDKKAELDALNRAIDALKKTPPNKDVFEAATKDPDVVAAQYRAHRLRDAAAFKARTANNPNHDSILRAKAEADTADAEWAHLRDKKAHDIELGHRQGEANKHFAQIERLKMDLESMGEREKAARSDLDAARKEVAELPPDLRKLSEIKPLVDPTITEIMTQENYYRMMTAQLIGLEFELQSPERVKKIQPASAPTPKDSKKQLLGTIVAGLLGFAVVGLGVVGVETSARKVSSLGELRSSNPTPVVGVIPWQPGTAIDAVRNADIGESIDKLRSYVSQTWLARGATTVAVTSPVGDEGKAFTAFGLANSLARAGYKTLLVDFDLRTPALHSLAGVDNGVGVCELLRGESDPRAAVVGLPDGLWFLPAGKWSEASRQAAVGGRLESLLAKLKEPFDCVILHGHSLLTAAETVEIARRAEVVLLCTLYRDTRLPLLKRAADRIAAMEVPYSGVVYLGATPQESLC